EAQLNAEVVGEGRASRGEVIEEPPPGRVGGAQPLGLGAAQRVKERGGLRAYQQVLAAVDSHAEVTAPGEGAEPGPLGGRPGGEPLAAGLGRLLVARLVKAGQGAVGGPGEQPAAAQERLSLVERPQRPVGAQPALEDAALEQRDSIPSS